MAKATSTADARASLEQVFDSIPNLDAKWRRLVEDAFAAERSREVSVGITCKCCEKYRKYVITVQLPDWAARVKALDLLLTQAKGKPAETKVVDLKVFAAQSRAELEAMSDEDLALIAAGSVDEKKGVRDGKQGKSPHARRAAASREAAPRVQGGAGTGRRSARERGGAVGGG